MSTYVDVRAIRSRLEIFRLSRRSNHRRARARAVAFEARSRRTRIRDAIGALNGYGGGHIWRDLRDVHYFILQ